MAPLRVERDGRQIARDIEPQRDARVVEKLGRDRRQIICDGRERVVARIYRPHDFIERADERVRLARDLREWLAHARWRGFVLGGEMREHGDFREARAEIVVQVARDARALFSRAVWSLEFRQATLRPDCRAMRQPMPIAAASASTTASARNHGRS